MCSAILPFIVNEELQLFPSLVYDVLFPLAHLSILPWQFSLLYNHFLLYYYYNQHRNMLCFSLIKKKKKKKTPPYDLTSSSALLPVVAHQSKPSLIRQEPLKQNILLWWQNKSHLRSQKYGKNLAYCCWFEIRRIHMERNGSSFIS